MKMMTVEIGLIVPNPWNPNKMSDFMMDRARASLKKHGMVAPINVREVKRDGELRYEIINGEHRWKVCVEQKHDTIPIANVGQVSERVAKELGVILNDLHGEHERGALAEIITDLLDQEDQAVRDATRDALPYSDAELKQFADVVDFDWSALDADRPDGERNQPEPPDTEPDSDTETFVFVVPKDMAESVRAALDKAKGEEGDDASAFLELVESYLDG